MLSENHERRREAIQRQLDWDSYSADLDRWVGFPSTEQLFAAEQGALRPVRP
jgi:hypothetical protein